MSAPRTRIGDDSFGAIVYAEAKDGYLLLTNGVGNSIVIYPEAYAALVKYVEQAREEK